MTATLGLSDLSSLHPMHLVRIPEPFDHEQFLFELKHDGFRALAFIRGHHCGLVSRRGHVYKFPQLAEELAHSVRADDAVLDGEIVCLDAQGRSQFYSLLFHREWPYFMAFDALQIDGEDLWNRPLLERKRRLKALVPRVETRFLYLDHVERQGIDLFRAVCRADLEGIVAKWKHGPYHTDGVTTSWLKIKNPTYSQAIGRSDAFEDASRARRAADGPLRFCALTPMFGSTLTLGRPIAEPGASANECRYSNDRLEAAPDGACVHRSSAGHLVLVRDDVVRR